MFPAAVEHPHTVMVGGAGTVRGIKSAMSRVSLELWPDALVVRGRLTGRVRLRIPLDSIQVAEPWERNQRLIMIHFQRAEWGRHARLMTSGQPAGRRDRIVLALRQPEEWIAELNERIGT